MKTIKASVLIIGSEVLDGRITDTNSNYLFREFKKSGFKAVATMTVDDRIEDIMKALEVLLDKSDLVITSGGLGPTTDDLTREALAEHFNLKLKTDQPTIEKLKSNYLRRKLEFPKSNEKQALYPEGAILLENDFGTAPAILLEKAGKIIICLPGVPSELKGIYQEKVAPILAEKFNSTLPFEKQFRFIGLPESGINEVISKLNLGDDINVIYQASFPEVKVILRTFSAENLSVAGAKLQAGFSAENIFSDNNQTLSEIVHALLISKKLTIAAAESCTAGLFTATLAANPGASAYLPGSLITYSNKFKQSLLGVPTEIFSNYGAVSAECAGSMALLVKEKFSTDIGVSITGIAGPEGGSAEKPVGTVWIGIADKAGIETFKIFFPSSRDKIRNYSTQILLNKLRIKLETLAI
jgi:nicotinamide-nucleotide amidase